VIFYLDFDSHLAFLQAKKKKLLYLSFFNTLIFKNLLS